MYEFSYGESVILIAEAAPLTGTGPADISSVVGLPTLVITRANSNYEPVDNIDHMAEFVTTFEAAEEETPARWVFTLLNSVEDPEIEPGFYSAVIRFTLSGGVIYKFKSFGIKIARSGV